jgi:uncharacterized protein (TIGR03067 family)
VNKPNIRQAPAKAMVASYARTFGEGPPWKVGRTAFAVIALSVVFSHVLGAQPPVGDEKPSKPSVMGKWRIQRLTFPGEDRVAAKGTLVVIDASTIAIHWAYANAPTKYEYVTNNKTSPPQIDLVDLGPTYGSGDPIKELGIYRIRGDRLEVCLGYPNRPNEFAAPGLGGINTQPSSPILYVLQRVK